MSLGQKYRMIIWIAKQLHSGFVYSFVMSWFWWQSYTPRLILSFPAIYLAQVHCGNYNHQPITYSIIFLSKSIKKKTYSTHMTYLNIQSFQARGDKEIKSKFNKCVPFYTSLVSWEWWLHQPWADFSCQSKNESPGCWSTLSRERKVI